MEVQVSSRSEMESASKIHRPLYTGDEDFYDVTPPPSSDGAQISLEAQLLRSQRVLNTISGIEGLDIQLLPSTFSALQVDYKWKLNDLGTLVLGQSLAHAISGIIWGHFADTTSRVILLSIGCCSWGLVSLLLSVATQYWQFFSLKVIDGLAIASIGPIAQSMIADLFPSGVRGEHFGWIQLFQLGGCIIGAIIGGSASRVWVLQGVRGWRLAFFLCGILSVIVGLLVPFMASEPRRSQGEFHVPIRQRLRKACLKLCRAALSKTFLILLFQGICGYIPIQAFQFYTMWFQYIGMPDYKAALLTTCPLVGGMAGSLFGGWFGDQAHKWRRHSGRPIVGQIGTLAAIPLVYIALLAIPRQPAYFGLYALVMLLLGFVISWCPSGVNRPILSEIVEPDARATVFAIQIALEASLAAALGSPIITTMAESLFGFKISDRSHLIGTQDHQRNIDALANSLLVATVFPWTISFFMYGLLHFTYRNDVIAEKHPVWVS